VSQEVYQIEGDWSEVLHRTAPSEITASLKIVVQVGALVGNTNGGREERIIRHVCVLETGVEILSKVART
jgi:hypothetical protein